MYISACQKGNIKELWTERLQTWHSGTAQQSLESCWYWVQRSKSQGHQVTAQRDFIRVSLELHTVMTTTRPALTDC